MIGPLPPPAFITQRFIPPQYYIVVHSILCPADAPVWRPCFCDGRKVELHISPAAAASQLRDVAELYGTTRVAIAKLVATGIETLETLTPARSDRWTPTQAQDKTLAPTTTTKRNGATS